MNRNCLLCGVGGQGTILASKLIADSALIEGLNARAAETIGMAQRGGSVVSHLRIGDNTYSPMIPKGEADIIIAFEPGEAVRCMPYLKKDGLMIVNKKAVKPTTSTLNGGSYNGEDMIDYLRKNISYLIIIDGEELCSICNSPKVLNVILLGAAVSSGCLNISMESMEKAIKNRLPDKLHELNIKALHAGASVEEKGRDIL